MFVKGMEGTVRMGHKKPAGLAPCGLLGLHRMTLVITDGEFVLATFAVQDTSASSSRFVKVKRSGLSAKLLSSICWRASLGEGTPVRADSIDLPPRLDTTLS